MACAYEVGSWPTMSARPVARFTRWIDRLNVPLYSLPLSRTPNRYTGLPTTATAG
jgi:hypothetical protein